MTKVVEVVDIPRVAGREIWHLAQTEYRRLADLLRQLATDDWSRPTDCPGWDVRAMALHVLGAMEGNASPAELIHQFRRGLPLNKTMEHHHWVDGVNKLQIDERQGLSVSELQSRLEATITKAVRGRRAVPPPLRWTPVPFGPPIGWKPLSYLLHMGFTRDTWMHRIDMARATQRAPTLSADHDGRIIADIVAEWAWRHRRPFTLTLGGLAGAVLSGRGAGVGLLQHKLPL